jgi:hypothetical protein
MEDNIEDNKYLLKMTDGDGDALTVSHLWSDNTLIMRIENDGTINGIIVDLPMAMSLMGVLLPFIQTEKLDIALDEFLNAGKDL